MDVSTLTTRQPLARLAQLEDETRSSPTHVIGDDGVTELNPRLRTIALEELAILVVLRRRRDRGRLVSGIPAKAARVR